jgi:hypothetical protein
MLEAALCLRQYRTGDECVNRQQWKDLLEGIGFLAIIASLVFVGLETRNGANQTLLNTQAMEISAYQELTNNISEMNALAFESEYAADVMANIFDVPDGEEFMRFSVLINRLRHGDMAFFMYQKGVIDEDRLLSTLRPLPLQSKGGQDFWRANKISFVKPYQDYIDRLIERDFFGSADLR